MHGRVFYLKELRYGFEEERFVLRVECFTESLGELEDPEFRIVIGGKEELTVVVNLERGRVKEYAVEKSLVCLLNPCDLAEVAFQRTLEVAVTARGAGPGWIGEVHGGRGAVARGIAD